MRLNAAGTSEQVVSCNAATPQDDSGICRDSFDAASDQETDAESDIGDAPKKFTKRNRKGLRETLKMQKQGLKFM